VRERERVFAARGLRHAQDREETMVCVCVCWRERERVRAHSQQKTYEANTSALQSVCVVCARENALSRREGEKESKRARERESQRGECDRER
jgi:hypothetical protein